VIGITPQNKAKQHKLQKREQRPVGINQKYMLKHDNE
jgi:hypothetical protein